MGTIKCLYCPMILDTEIRADNKTYIVQNDFEHLQEHLYPDHKEIRENEEAIERIENFI